VAALVFRCASLTGLRYRYQAELAMAARKIVVSEATVGHAQTVSLHTVTAP
jgi:hypothetical protein